MAQAKLHQSSSGLTLPWNKIRHLYQGFIALIATWQSRAKQRRELMEMEPRILRDLGLSRVEATLESAKPFWRP